MPDVPTGGWVLRVQVPDGIFTLAIEADEHTAAIEHAAFADRCEPLLLRAVGGDAAEMGWLRDDLVSQLDALRQSIRADGLGYLGALAGEHEGRHVLILLAIAATPAEFPDGVDPASLLAAMLRGQHPEAAVEEFPTARAAGVGIRRCETLRLPSGGADDGPLTIDVGISQALVPFPEAGLLGQVTGCSLPPEDVDVATVFTAMIAHHMTASARERPLRTRDRDSHEVAVSVVQEATAGTRQMADDTARQSRADQVTLRKRGRGGQAAAPCPFGVDLPAAEPEADALGVSGEDQRLSGIAAERDQATQFGARVAVAQEFRVVDEHDAAPAERG
jgi:hypothetical protein